MSQTLTLKQIKEAAERIRGHVVHTPVLKRHVGDATLLIKRGR